jgi:choline kinase
MFSPNSFTAIILAAGRGTRLDKYTQDLPKGMLRVEGQTLIERQIALYRSVGIKNILVVRGYKSEKINYKNIEYFDNHDYASTNMVESLFSAKEKLRGNVIISYSDLLFDQTVLSAALNSNADIGAVVDLDWRSYWRARYGKIDFDLESLKLSIRGEIMDIGKESPISADIDGRFVGIVKLSAKGSEIFQKIYYQNKSQYWGKTWINNRIFQKIYMTDFLSYLIEIGITVMSIGVTKGWYEFDTNEDYEKFSILQSTRQRVMLNDA